MFPQLPVQTSNECMRTDTLNSDPFLIFDGTCHEIKNKPTTTPPSTVTSAADNHLLPLSDDDDDNDADPTNLMGKYDGGENKKGKGGNFRRYRDDDKIKALHGLHEEPKDDNDNSHDNDDNDGIGMT